MSRREYPIRIEVNFKEYLKVIIDPHYEEKHAESISDEIILELVKQLDGEVHVAKAIDKDGFSYFVREGLLYKSKKYRLVWLTHDDEIYIGVVNAYRR